jgi:uncharacterized protein (DUF2461 family)
MHKQRHNQNTGAQFSLNAKYIESMQTIFLNEIDYDDDRQIFLENAKEYEIKNKNCFSEKTQ